MPDSNPVDLNSLLEQGIAACKAGDLAWARAALIAALKIDPKSEAGWLWLSSSLTNPDERRACLKRVLAINPEHAAARDGLNWLDTHYPPERPAFTPAFTTSPEDLFSLPEASAPARAEPRSPAEPAGDASLTYWSRLVEDTLLPEADKALPIPDDLTTLADVPLPPAEDTLAALMAVPPLPPAPAKPLKTVCPWCGSSVSGLDEICPTCHRQLEFSCPNCGSEIQLDETACSNCGWQAGDFEQRASYLRNLGEAYVEKGLPKKARPVYRYLLEIEPDNAEHLMKLSKIYGQLDQTEESIAAAEQVLALAPEHPEALDRLGRWYVVRGDEDGVTGIVERLNKLSAPTPSLRLLLGDLEFERRKYPAAFRAYQRAIAQPEFDAPALARLNYRLGEMYLVAEDTMAALQAFGASIATGAEIHEVELARVRIAQIRPPLPPSATRSASETLRSMAGPLLLVWLTGIVQVGFRFNQLNVAGAIGLAAAVPGSYLLASAISTPQAMEWRTLLGSKGLGQPLYGALVAMLGAIILITSIVLILFGA